MYSTFLMSDPLHIVVTFSAEAIAMGVEWLDCCKIKGWFRMCGKIVHEVD